MPKPKTVLNSVLSVISAVEAVKNILSLQLDLVLIRAKYCIDDVKK